MVISSRKFENFKMFCPLGAMKLGVTESDSAKPGPHIHIFFNSGVTGTCRNGDKE